MAAAEPPTVVVIAEPDRPHQAAFIRGLRGELAGAASLDERPPEAAADVDPSALVVAVGQRAGAAVAAHRSGRWRLYGLISRGAARGWMQGDPRAAARVVEQPPHRMVALLTAVLPDARRIGLLLGPDSRPYGRRLVGALEAADREPVVRRVETGAEVEPVVEALFGESQALLVPADPAVINRRTAVPLIQGAYLRGVPLMGPGRSSVRAGALMALHTEPAALGRAAAEEVAAALSGRPPAGRRYPVDFRVVVNYGVARALGLVVPSEQQLRRQLQEGRP
ncbi:MAG: ABC transporter substrate-binding protein [Pseudomonadota bacterium]